MDKQKEVENMNLANMSMGDRSLLLYFENGSTDYGGKIAAKRMNTEEFDLARDWQSIGFIDFGRIKSNDIIANLTHWVELSEKAWTLAHEERRARCKRIYEYRTWEKTSE